MNLYGKTSNVLVSSTTDCLEVHSPHAEPEGYDQPYDSRNAVSQNFMLENDVTNHPSFADPEDHAKVVQTMELIGVDSTAGDHEDDQDIKTQKSCDEARSKIKEQAITPNLLLENTTILVGYSDLAPADNVEVNQTSELKGGDSDGDDEKYKTEKCDVAGIECKEVADPEAQENFLSESVAVVENGTDNEFARNLGDGTEPKHCTRPVSEHKYCCNFAPEIEIVAGNGREETEQIHYKAEKERIHYKYTTSEIGVVVMDHGMNELSPRKLGQIEPNHYQSFASEIEVAVDDGTDNSEKIQPAKIGSKPYENIVGTKYTKHLLPQNENFQEGRKEIEFDNNCEIQEGYSCADESGVVDKLNHTGDVELSQIISPKPTLAELFRLAEEDESSVQKTAVVMNTRDFDSWDPCGNSYESSEYEGFSSQNKCTIMKNPNAAVEQYHEDILDDYERRTCTPLFQVKDRSNEVVNKAQWRKVIDDIFSRFNSLRKRQPNPLGEILDEIDLKSLMKAANSKRCERKKIGSIKRKTFWGRLACCSSATGSVFRSHKRKKPKEWELQLQRYVSEYSPAW